MSWTVYMHKSPSGKIYIGITGRKPEKRWDNGNGYKHCPHMAAAVNDLLEAASILGQNIICGDSLKIMKEWEERKT